MSDIQINLLPSLKVDNINLSFDIYKERSLYLRASRIAVRVMEARIVAFKLNWCALWIKYPNLSRRCLREHIIQMKHDQSNYPSCTLVINLDKITAALA